MKVFEDIHKYLTLLLSDRVSSDLKIRFDLKNIDCVEQEFQSFSAGITNFSYISLFKYKNRGILLCIDPKIVYILTNRMLGGKGVLETKPRPVFTFSEKFTGERITNWFSDFYRESRLETKFLRVETDLDLVHFFYPDELVYGVDMKCKINQEVVGSISVCYPRIIMDKRESAWAV